MEEKERKELLQRISSLRMEAKLKLKMISFLYNEKSTTYNREVDMLLDKLKYLDELEKELNKESK